MTLLPAFVAALAGARVSHANIGDTYGFGSRSAALGGATVSGGFEGYASYTNPAAVAMTGDKRLVLSWSLMDMIPSFTPIPYVIVESPYVIGISSPRYDSVDLDYSHTLGQALGLTYQLMPEWHRFSFGLTAYLPLQHAAYMDTGEPFVPEYTLYRSRTQRPQVEFALGAEAAPGIYVGAGAHLAFSLTSKAKIFLQSNTANPSSMRFLSSLKPKIAPYFGVLYDSPAAAQANGSGNVLPPRGTYSAGAVIRFPISSANNMRVESAARALGTLAVLDFNFPALSTLFYDPLSIEAGGSYQYSARARAYLQVDYQFWSKFEAPTLTIVDPSVKDCQNSGFCGVNISRSQNPVYPYRNLLIPRVGHEYALNEKVTLRAGYAYRGSIYKGLPTGSGNALDPPKHMLNAGVGLKFQHFLNFETPCTVDLHASYHALVTQTVIKTPGDEKGNGSGDQKIGAPGYDAGGKIFGGGVSLTLAF